MKLSEMKIDEIVKLQQELVPIQVFSPLYIYNIYYIENKVIQNKLYEVNSADYYNVKYLKECCYTTKEEAINETKRMLKQYIKNAKKNFKKSIEIISKKINEE